MTETDSEGLRLAAQLHRELVARGATLGTAESLTGGMLGMLLTAAPRASESYRGGVVTYATDVKEGLLGVSGATVERHGVVSEPGAREMAEGARRLLGSTFAVSTTGVAGPGSQEGHPPGTVFVAVAGPNGTRVTRLALDGDRAAIRSAACRGALRLTIDAVVGAAG